MPVVLFSYLNPILAAGADALTRAAEAGAGGILVTDIPVGADPEREEWLGNGPLAFIRLVAPTTPRERMARCPSRQRIRLSYQPAWRHRCAGEHDRRSCRRRSRRLRSTTTLPICVGFGISTPAQARSIGRLADGVVVGSAIVSAADEGPAAVLRFTRSLREGLDG